MDISLLIARLLLGAVFVVAGGAKLADRAGGRRALIDFGVPAPLATPLATGLPLVELSVAVALLPGRSAWWGATSALALMLLFSAAIAINLARGRRPDCRCFGQLRSAPIGQATLIRNAALIGIAAFVVWCGREQVGPNAVGWLANLTPAQTVSLFAAVVIAAVLAVQGWLLLKLLAQNGRLLLRLEALEKQIGGAAAAVGLPLGALAPAFSLRDLRGETHTLGELRAFGKPILLLFTDPECGPCNALMPEIGRWQWEHAEKFTLTLVSRGTAEANRVHIAGRGLSRVLLQHDFEVAEAYQTSATPSAVLVRPDGAIGSSVATGDEAVRALVAEAVGRPRPIPPLAAPAHGQNGYEHAHGPLTPTGLPIGERAPALELPDLDGKLVRLPNSESKTTLLLFWSPDCGLCQQMLPALKTWEVNRLAEAPELVVVSAGSVEANRAMGLRSAVVLDDAFTAGRAFGADGTPSGVLVDADGRIASPLAVGAATVLALTAARHEQAHPPGARIVRQP